MPVLKEIRPDAPKLSSWKSPEGVGGQNPTLIARHGPGSSCNEAFVPDSPLEPQGFFSPAAGTMNSCRVARRYRFGNRVICLQIASIEFDGVEQIHLPLRSLAFARQLSTYLVHEALSDGYASYTYPPVECRKWK